MYIVLFIATFAFLILAHEFGHFIVAKRNGIKVEEFGIGFPPRLFGYKKGETIYSVNLLPIGGFVKIYGENGLEEGETQDRERSFVAKPASVKAKVLVAGVVCNLIAGWLFMSVALMFGLPVSTSNASGSVVLNDVRVVIIQVSPDSPAANAGITMGDELVDFATTKDFQNFVAENKGKEVEIKYRRGERIFLASLIPRVNPPAGEGSIGVLMDEAGVAQFTWLQSLWEGLKMTYYLSYAIIVTIFGFIVNLIKGVADVSSVMGPVGIVHFSGTVAKLGISRLLSFVSILSINLAVLNLIPFPALDGGRLLFLLIEKIKGSPINPKFNAVANGLGLALLLLLMIVITYQDIIRIF